MKKIILGIETSCDETAMAMVQGSGPLRQPKFRIIKALIHSQIPIHQPFGGVVPNLAKREHLKNLPILLASIDPQKKLLQKIDAVAVTVGPGLEPALWTGIEFAKILSRSLKKTLIGVNHLEGHLNSFILDWQKKKIKSRNIFPAVALVVSGGHTLILKLNSIDKWKRLGETRDDAVGEAFDKVARLLGLPYPGGPEIEKLANAGNDRAIDFPEPMKYQNNFDFSYSGLKTSVLYYLKNNPDTNKADVAASFQRAATEVLVYKTARALKIYQGKSIILCGGVAANKSLRKKMKQLAKKEKINFFVPEFKHNTDNAVMIAMSGYINIIRKKKYPLRANGAISI